MSESAQTIDEVIDRLTEIVKQSKAEESQMGYFAALYRKVTMQIKSDIDNGFFENNQRMERFDVVFANRYITAYDHYKSGSQVTKSWGFAFEMAQQWRPIVLQHLLLGLNAHINLDLGIAAARVCPGAELPGLKNDFDRINLVLSKLVGSVQEELARIWPVLRIMNRFLGSVQKVLINFSMTQARDQAWRVAQQLAPLNTEQQEVDIVSLDQEIADFGRVIRYPGLLGSLTTLIVRLGERGTVVDRISILE